MGTIKTQSQTSALQAATMQTNTPKFLAACSGSKALKSSLMNFQTTLLNTDLSKKKMTTATYPPKKAVLNLKKITIWPVYLLKTFPLRIKSNSNGKSDQTPPKNCRPKTIGRRNALWSLSIAKRTPSTASIVRSIKRRSRDCTKSRSFRRFLISLCCLTETKTDSSHSKIWKIVFFTWKTKHWMMNSWTN